MTNRDGPELILKVIEAARAWYAECGEFGPVGPLDGAMETLVNAIEALNAALWVKGTWADVIEGDRIRVPVAGGGHAEADVYGVSTQTWVGSGATQVRVTLSYRPDKPYTMNPSGPVEILQPQDWARDAWASLRDTFGEIQRIEEGL